MNTAMQDSHSYYATPGPMTDSGPYADMFEGLPRDIPSIVKVIQGNLVHIFWAERYGLNLSEERKGEVQYRRVDRQLARIRQLDHRPLTEPRPLEQKLVSNCRDHSTLMAAILRHQGVPARARCGFGAYFMPDHFEDHWVCEYWNEEQGRWVLVDAQLDDLQQRVLGTTFDTLDVPRDQFVVAGQAWQMARSGKEDPAKFGIFNMQGWGFIAGNVVRDFLAQNKLEILPWDGGNAFIETISLESTDKTLDVATFDRLAELTQGGDETFAQVRALYESDPRFHLRADMLQPLTAQA